MEHALQFVLTELPFQILIRLISTYLAKTFLNYKLLLSVSFTQYFWLMLIKRLKEELKRLSFRLIDKFKNYEYFLTYFLKNCQNASFNNDVVTNQGFA